LSISGRRSANRAGYSRQENGDKKMIYRSERNEEQSGSQSSGKRILLILPACRSLGLPVRLPVRPTQTGRTQTGAGRLILSKNLYHGSRITFHASQFLLRYLRCLLFNPSFFSGESTRPEKRPDHLGIVSPFTLFAPVENPSITKALRGGGRSGKRIAADE
jgi:hypothetical protein